MTWITVFFFLLILINSVQNKFEEKRNVLMIIMDDFRPAIFAYGDRLAKTPNIDKFVEKSFYFTRAYAQQALCAPSRNSMLTGRRPDTIHLYDFYNYWRTFVGNFTTLPQYFKENGYLTHSVGKVFHPGISSNFTDDYPLSWSNKPFHPKTESFMNSAVCPDGSGVKKKNLICPIRVHSQPLQTLPDIESANEACRFLKNNKKQAKPFFLAVGFHKPHIPFRFPKKFLGNFSETDFDWKISPYKPLDMPDIAWNPFTDIRMRDDFANLSIPLFGPIPKEKAIKIRESYYAAVSYVDDLFGKILTEVNLENTIVLLTSDHGWSLGEHGEWAKYSNFEISLRVPFILYSPEFQLKKRKPIKHIIELIDVFPTLIDLANLSKLPKCKTNKKYLKACVEGKSLYKILKNNSKGTLPNIALSQYPRPNIHPKLKSNTDKPRLNQIKVMGYSIRTNNFRYTMWIKFTPKNFTRHWNKIYARELYDHRFDDEEAINLVNSSFYKQTLTRLENKLITCFSK
ncbi:iduronate 2-sulfatase [Condylostylus longicornis]|uniref:iduronate 2-sulfatase n=1 Tax=Condylostylus longicornis TaxID=2530218 RepID=UPI00244D9C6E|nr:iduronate 2-sulfatase [Condylostylus longicornis]